MSRALYKDLLRDFMSRDLMSHYESLDLVSREFE